MAKSMKTKVVEQKPADTKADTEAAKRGTDSKEATPSNQSSGSPPAPKDFESHYLQQITAEFADDIDRLRSAKDFTDESLPILIGALKQGACVYSEEEKRKVMGQL